MKAQGDHADDGTREKLLRAADRLFFRKGYDAVSIRDLTEAAGVNVASINYHFRGKKNLFREAMRLRLSGMAQERLKWIKEVMPEGKSPGLDIVIRAYVMSFLEHLPSSREAEAFMNIVSAEMGEGGIATDVLFKEMVYPVHKAMKDAIMRARPGLSERKVQLCLASITGQVIHFIRARGIIKRITGSGYSREFLEEVAAHITEFSLSGIGK